MVQIIDNLQKFGPIFQTKCIATLLVDKKFLEQIHDIVELDYFESESQRWIVQNIKEYYDKYRDIITLEVFKIQSDTIQSESFKASIIQNLKSVYKRLSDSDLEYIKEQFLSFCKNQKLKKAIIDSVDLLKVGEYEKIKHKVDDALKAGVERDLGHDYITGLEKRMSELSRETIKTNWQLIDELMHGGLGKGELGVIVAPSGAGKSWVLSKLGAEAMKVGKNVAHFTLELNEFYVGLRYDSIFSTIDFQSVREHKDKIKKIIEKINGKLKIKLFPTKTVSVHGLRSYLERLADLEFKPDVVIVDYADLLKSVATDRNSNSYSEMGGIYEELRGMAGEFQIPIWTASQTNRTGNDDDIIEAGSVADSYRKIMTADFVMSVSRKRSDKLTNTARFHVMKNRFGADGLTFPAHMDTSNGDIRIYDENSSEGVEIQKSMKSGKNIEKEHMLDTLKKIQKNKDLDKNLG